MNSSQNKLVFRQKVEYLHFKCLGHVSFRGFSLYLKKQNSLNFLYWRKTNNLSTCPCILASVSYCVWPTVTKNLKNLTCIKNIYINMYIPTYTTYLCMLSIRSKNMGNSHLILCQSSSFVWTNDIATTWNNKLTFIKQFLFRIIWVTN